MSAETRPPSCYDERAIQLPNGCWLEPGGRVRLPAEQIWEIPNEVVERLGLELEARAASPGSEVICWPLSAAATASTGEESR